jgi:hypothetical protein
VIPRLPQQRRLKAELLSARLEGDRRRAAVLQARMLGIR